MKILIALSVACTITSIGIVVLSYKEKLGQYSRHQLNDTEKMFLSRLLLDLAVWLAVISLLLL